MQPQMPNVRSSPPPLVSPSGAATTYRTRRSERCFGVPGPSLYGPPPVQPSSPTDTCLAGVRPKWEHAFTSSGACPYHTDSGLSLRVGFARRPGVKGALGLAPTDDPCDFVTGTHSRMLAPELPVAPSQLRLSRGVKATKLEVSTGSAAARRSLPAYARWHEGQKTYSVVTLTFQWCASKTDWSL